MRTSSTVAVLAACVSMAAPPAAAAAPRYENPTVSNERGRTFWSTVYRSVGVRARPDRRARVVGRLGRTTYYGFREVVVRLREHGRWTKVRFSGIGGRRGWVPTSALDAPRRTRMWVLVDRRRKRLRVYRGKRRVLNAQVGVGARGSPTPGGRYFVRERLVPANPRGIYGVLAFGLSAYSAHRTDWPGGGQVGIHGTNQPGLIPGRISNGCIRMRNGAVRRLGRLVGRGTPVHVR